MTMPPPSDRTELRDVPYAFRYRLPEEFVTVEDPATVEGWAEALAELMPGAGTLERAQSAEKMRRSLPLFLERGDTLVDVAMCLGAERVRSEDKLSYGLLVVSVRPSDHGERLLTAEGIYRAKERLFFAGEPEVEELDFALGKGVRGRQDMLLATKLPNGPGVMSASLRTVELRTADQVPEGAGSSRTQKIPMAVLQLIVPAPGDYCAYVTIATPSVYLLDSYSERLAHIGRTFTFDTQTAVKAASGHRTAQAAVRAPHGDGA
ncbi:hypothetical protein ACIBSR_16440 [Streptomyces sp. NPDC049936]|uniref:hypothetical protein n=1 Tax=Streptomyces sp. NPDC049936 TaxID=3365599 RepID=UPI0037AB5ECB